jgi:hypothetical protein
VPHYAAEWWNFMKLFSHKQEEPELKIESDEDLSIEDILAEYKAEATVRYNREPQPDGQGEYYSSSQGGAETYYDSESFAPAERSAPASRSSQSVKAVEDSNDVDALYNKVFSQYYEGPYQGNVEPEEPAASSPAPTSAPEHSGNVGAMEQEALDVIAQMRKDDSSKAKPKKVVDLYAPIQEDERPYTAPSARSQRKQDVEIDNRFNLSGKKDNSGYKFGSHAIDTSADKSYTPAKQDNYNLSHWAHEVDPDSPEAQEDVELNEKKHIFKKLHKKKPKDELGEMESEYETQPIEDTDDDYVQGFRDHKAAKAEYAQDDSDYGQSSNVGSISDVDDLPSFQEYLASIVASVFLRLRGTNRNVTNSTMVDNQEELGPELTPAGACRYYGSFMRSQKLRLRIAAVMELVLCYISLGLPIPGMLQNLQVSAAACIALQLAIMLLCLDVVTNAVLNAARLKPGVDSLAVLSCILTTIDGLLVALSDSFTAHTPLCAVSSLSLLGVMLASSLNTRGMRKAFRVPAIGKYFYAVTGETKLRKGELTLLKSMRPANGFVRRTEEASPDETLFNKLSPALMVLALVFAIIVVAAKRSPGNIIFVFSAILAPAAPFCALLAYALPYFMGSMRIFKSGAAIAGWSGLCDIGASRNLILTDSDLFPEDSIEMDAVRIFSDESAEKVIAYAGTLVSASGSTLSGSFVRLMEENGCKMRSVENFEPLSGGGLKGIIEGHIVLCGGVELMRLMNVRIPYRLTDKTSVLLAIDGILYGIFSLKYTPLPQVRRALVDLVRSGRHPVFAIRDFNVNPEMLHNTFDIATDGYDFPPYVERFTLSESSPTETKIAAVICNEGLGPLTKVADVGHSMYVAVRFNTVCAAVAAVLGCFTVFIKLLSAGSVTIGFLIFTMLLWTVPILLSSFYVATK